LKILIFLFFAHLIGDFFLRTNFINIYKSKNLSILFLHCFIWTGCISVVLEYFKEFNILKFIFLLTGHFIIDYFKVKIDPNPIWLIEKENIIQPDISRYKVGDQILHVVQLIIVYLW